jgi:uncharacterized protein
MTEDIRIYEFKRLDLRKATVIDGFPSVGLVSTICANYLISTLKLEHIGILDSIHFPTVSVVRGGEPLNPVRIYSGTQTEVKAEAGENYIVVFISEFQPPPTLIKPIASTILDWMQEQGCGLLISPEGLVVERNESKVSVKEEGAGEPSNDEIEAYGIGSTPNARAILEKHGIPQFQEGVISGVAGVLLNEGKRRDFDVISILAEAKPNYPDARAAAKVIEAIDKILWQIDIDVKPLYKEAENIETRIKAMQRQAKAPPKRLVPTPSMYG